MSNSIETYFRPSLLRYLGVMLYDTLLLLSVLLAATVIAVAINGGEAITRGNPFFLIYLFTVSFLFYGWFWTHGGQTLGMRSWKVYLTSHHGSTISWQRAFIRFSVAIISWIPLGLGFWWQYLGKNNQSWPDMLSGTRLIYSKQAKPTPLSPLS
ncbi:MAG: RDD family protein [Gammaproteobacteria bacterium]|nr:RDD family protein [Gammaproteobacteria bacterium]MDH5592077.1 RDD family protein [Gammaproteobacteria bacterium]